MLNWIENWLTVGLFINWMGHMMLQYGKKDPNNPYRERVGVKWWHEVIGICLWPFALAMGFVAGVTSRRRK